MPIDTIEKAIEFYKMADTILNHEDVKSMIIDGDCIKYIELIDEDGITTISYQRIARSEW